VFVASGPGVSQVRGGNAVPYDSLPLQDRLRLWGDTLQSLAEPARSERLVQALNEGNRDALERLVGDRLFSLGSCIDIVEILTRVVNFAPPTLEERCAVIPGRIRPLVPSTTDGAFYRLFDGRFVWVSEAEWWKYHDNAVNDAAWLMANHDLLLALGIIACHWENVPGGRIVQIDRQRTLCFPAVNNPFDARTA
jgi:hypothetical protein